MAVSEWQGAQHTTSRHVKYDILYFALLAWDPKSQTPLKISFAIYPLATHRQA